MSRVVGNPEFAPNEQPAWRPKQGKRHALVGRQISGLLTSLAPWTGAPGSHQRTWEEKDGAKPPPKLWSPDQVSVTPGVKAFEKTIFNPGTLVRPWGTRPGGKAWP